MEPSLQAARTSADVAAFAIGFDRRDRERLHALWDRVIDSNRWTEGPLVAELEAAWEDWNGLPAVATGGWSGAALAALEFAGVRGRTVLCPSNTFAATPLATMHAGARVEFVDCNREDLCMSFEDFERRAERERPAAAWLVHIGGHIAFDSERIAAYCREHGIFLIEDCAHAHGASWNGTRPGQWGDAGVYSLYATKTISTGEGGVLVSRHPELIEFARKHRNYGKPEHEVHGLNHRMSEFTAALGLVQVERLEEIVAWKNARGARAARPAASGAPRAARRDGVGPLQVHRLRADRALHRQGLRRALPPHLRPHAHGAAEQRLGGREPLVRAALLPPGGGRMKVLVTGGAGFIGSHVVDQLIEAGHSVRILDLTLSPWHPRGETELGSITEPDVVDRAVAGCDAVVHLAAVADVNHVHKGPSGAENVNTRGTANVLDAARRAGVERVVYGSTTWVYSDCAEDEVDEDTAVPPPTHLYTATKLAGELYCKAYAESYGLSASILRFGIPYGPRAREAAVVPAFVGKALRGEPLTVAGSGEQFRNFVYVVDLAEGIVSALDAPAGVSVYNLAHGDVTTISEIAETVKATVGDVEIVRTPARPGDFGGKRVSSERARAELGWTARTRLRRRGAPVRGVAGVQQRDRPRGHHQGADAERRHRRGPRPAGARDRAGARGRAARASRPPCMDGLDEMGWLPRRLGKDNSRFVFERLPWLFSFQYFLITHQPTRWIAQKLLTLVGGGKLRKLIERHGADLVVATYPGVSAVLGELRRRGKLDVPLYSAITDLAGLWWWAHPGVDMHFVIHPESIPEVEAIAGEGSVRWARPPIMPAFHEPRSRAGAREALGLPAEGPIVLVSGGGWGVGDVEGAVETALEQDGVHVVVLCGRSDELRERLARRFGADPRLRLEGFTERMSDFMAASEALVHTTAGLTVLEAIIRGCTPISYGFSVAHVKVNDRAYEHHGLARTARRRSDLRPGAAGRARRAARSRPLVRPPAADLLDRARGPLARPAAAGLAAARGARRGGGGHVRGRLAVDALERRRLPGLRVGLPLAAGQLGGHQPAAGRPAGGRAPGRAGRRGSLAGAARPARLVRGERAQGAAGRVAAAPHG